MGEAQLQAINRFSPMIGEMAIAFALAEYALEECVVEICNRHEAARRFEREFPRSLSRKVTFLRRCFNQISALSSGLEEKSERLKGLRQMEEMAEHRNWLIHGAPAPDEPSAYRLKLRRIRYEDNAPFCEEKSYGYRDVWDLVQECSIISINALFLAHFVKTNWSRRSANSP
jgi:hypothetical protein